MWNCRSTAATKSVANGAHAGREYDHAGESGRVKPPGCGLRGSFSMSAAGQRSYFNHYTLDGAENTDPNFNAFLYLPSLDALQEFKVETGVTPAEYGHNLTQINVTSKSGTNALHGSLFEFIRNSAVDAKNYFDRATAPIPRFQRNQFGGTVGGAIQEGQDILLLRL